METQKILFPLKVENFVERIEGVFLSYKDLIGYLEKQENVGYNILTESKKSGHRYADGGEFEEINTLLDKERKPVLITNSFEYYNTSLDDSEDYSLRRKKDTYLLAKEDGLARKIFEDFKSKRVNLNGS